MSDVKVTREHRLAAMDAVDPSRPSWLGKRWIETGDAYCSLQEKRVAEALARAEHNLRAAVIADLRVISATADIVDQGSSVLYVRVDSIELLLETLEAQQS
jgi:hypothetical protein